MSETTQLTITLRPIETAPRDGKPFYVVRKSDKTTQAMRCLPCKEAFISAVSGITYGEREMGTWFSHWFRLGDTEPTTGE